jgi:tetratricopeptide (TPR) repeat protein
LGPRADEPPVPEGLDLKELPRGVRAELRGLSAKSAEVVGAYLLQAGKLVDEDPEAAYLHAEAARRRAPRLPITREAAGETAYAAAHYDVALNEFRAMRRMGGGAEYLALMADCERALGRPQQALKLVKEGLAADPDLPSVVELRLVEAGVRREIGQTEEALRLLRKQIEAAGPRGTKLSRARLRYAYADHLEAAGKLAEAEQWFATAAMLDTEGTTDAAERVAQLQGLTLELGDLDDEPEDADTHLEEADE